MENYAEHGFDIEGEDPRIFILNETVYVIFICLSPYENQNRCIGITKFDEWEPVFLQIEDMDKNMVEKNWAPFVKDDKIYFVYNYDPLIIIHYDLNKDGICRVVYTQDNCTLPFNTSETLLRGGSNLIHYRDGYYIGGCHSRIFKECFIHYTHFIVLDTNNWELVYVSKPVIYHYDLNNELPCWWLSPGLMKKLDTMDNVLLDKSPHLIQDPISFYCKNEIHYLTVNIRDCVTLLYEITFDDIMSMIQHGMPVGYYNCFIQDAISK